MAEEPASSITVNHHFDAVQKVVWDAWTDPEVVRRWWGSDPDGVVTSAALDVRPGGRFVISFQDSSGDLHTCTGEYLRVEELTELEFTWSWLSEDQPPITSECGASRRMKRERECVSCTPNSAAGRITTTQTAGDAPSQNWTASSPAS